MITQVGQRQGQENGRRRMSVDLVEVNLLWVTDTAQVPFERFLLAAVDGDAGEMVASRRPLLEEVQDLVVRRWKLSARITSSWGLNKSPSAR